MNKEIKASDFRIGNLVEIKTIKWNYIEVPVLEVLENKLKLLLPDGSSIERLVPDEVTPLKITADKFYRSNFRLYNQQNAKGNFEYWYYNDPNMDFIRIESDNGYYFAHKEWWYTTFDYWHEVQNFFKAITGADLKMD